MALFPAVYRRSLRWALISQVVGALLAFMVLDFGSFAFRFLCFSLGFWLAAGILMLLRRQPSTFEGAIVSSGPMVLFCIMFLLG